MTDKDAKSSQRVERGRASHKRGKNAEMLCRIALWLKGYRIVATRYKTHQGEIDLIATRGSKLAFIEVKARPSLNDAAEAVSQHQQARLSRTASLFMAHARGFSRFSIQFDVMYVIPWHWPIHIENAFEAHVRK